MVRPPCRCPSPPSFSRPQSTAWPHTHSLSHSHALSWSLCQASFASKHGVDDMVMLTSISESSIMDNLKKRHANDIIYVRSCACERARLAPTTSIMPCPIESNSRSTVARQSLPLPLARSSHRSMLPRHRRADVHWPRVDLGQPVQDDQAALHRADVARLPRQVPLRAAASRVLARRRHVSLDDERG